MPRQQGNTPNTVKAALVRMAAADKYESYGSSFNNAKALKTSNYSSAALGMG